MGTDGGTALRGHCGYNNKLVMSFVRSLDRCSYGRTNNNAAATPPRAACDRCIISLARKHTCLGLLLYFGNTGKAQFSRDERLEEVAVFQGKIKMKEGEAESSTGVQEEEGFIIPAPTHPSPSSLSHILVCLVWKWQKFAAST